MATLASVSLTSTSLQGSLSPPAGIERDAQDSDDAWGDAEREDDEWADEDSEGDESDTEESFSDRCHGVVSCTFTLAGEAIALPFRILHGVFRFVF